MRACQDWQISKGNQFAVGSYILCEGHYGYKYPIHKFAKPLLFMAILIIYVTIRKESGNQQDILHQTQQELHQYHMTLERSDKMRGELEATLQSEIKYVILSLAFAYCY